MKMKAAIVRQATDPYKFEEVELAEPKNDEVLVRITASGLCHTDEFGRTLGMSPIVCQLFWDMKGSASLKNWAKTSKTLRLAIM